jgi:predicted transcriptional regulator
MLGLLATFIKTHNLDLQISEEDNRMYYKCYGVIQMSSRTINVRLPETLYKQIEDLAKATARTKSFLAIEALTNYVQSESWQINDIRQGLDEADSGDFASDKEVEAVFLKYGA